jgi:hypothetical protein
LLVAVETFHSDSACMQCRPNFLFTVLTLAAIGVKVMWRILPLRPHLRRVRRRVRGQPRHLAFPFFFSKHHARLGPLELTRTSSSSTVVSAGGHAAMQCHRAPLSLASMIRRSIAAIF